MIVEVPYYYVLPYIPHKARKERRGFVRDSVAVEIAEVPEAEAPVALRIRTGTFSRRRAENEPDDFRFWNGSLWRAYTVSAKEDGVKTFRDLSAEEFVADCVAGHGLIGYAGLDWQMRDSVPLDSLMPCRPQADPAALKAAEERRLQERAQDFLFVGGIAYGRASEPLYKVSETGLWERYRSIEVIKMSDVDAGTDPADLFRADRFEDAFAEFERRYGDIEDEDGEDDAAKRRARYDRIEVLMPEALRFRYDMGPRVEKEAAWLLEGLKDSLADNDIAFAAAYIRLRDAVAPGTAVDHDAVARLIGGELADAMRANGSADWKIERADALLREWLNRDDPSLVRDADVAALNAM